MSNDTPSGQIVIQRHIDDKNEAIVAHGFVDGLLEAYLDHTRLWSKAPDPLGEVMMRQALGGLALYLSCRPLDQVSAFTINIPKPATNIFVAGDCQKASVTGRIFTENIKTSEEGRLFVDTHRIQGNNKSSRSIIAIKGIDVLGHFEQYCYQSDQSKCRFFELADAEYLMVASLPVKDNDWIDSLDRDSAAALLKTSRPLDERRFWFQCGCDRAVMIKTVKNIYADRMDELFQEDETVKVTCPRCARTWELNRESLGES